MSAPWWGREAEIEAAKTRAETAQTQRQRAEALRARVPTEESP